MGTDEPKMLSTHPHLWAGPRCVSSLENEELMRSFTLEELDAVLKETKIDTAPGPDGLLVLFYKKFWPMLRRPVLQILNGFAMGTVDIARLNFGILSLIPKVPGADDIKQFRPIALINVIFKLVSKAYAIRLSPVAHRTISPAQTAFIKGRFIQDGPLALHEIIHELKSKKLPAVLLKLDFEKAYDRVSWDFLREVLLRKGFEPALVHRIMQLVTGGQTAISINGEVGPYFKNKRGVRQGDPLSVLLFDFLADALDVILVRAREAGHIQGVVSHLIPGGVTHLQYANNTMILI
jgi:mannosylglycoprotein endo-beta-mannosidase